MAGVMLLPAALPAQTKDRLVQRNDLLGWEAVGRLDMPGSACTGALIARDLVLTAAHCVVDRRTGQPIDARQVTFRAGHAHGHDLARQVGAQIVVDPSYRGRPDGKISGEMMRHDIALLRLDQPIQTHGVNPYVVFDGVKRGRKVILASYGQDRMESLTLERGCAVQERHRNGLIGFDCDATFGSSGAPVFTRENGRLRILSIISGGGESANGQMRAYGMDLPRKVAALKVRMRNSTTVVPTPGVKRLRVGDRGAEGGARFLRAPGG